MSTPLVSVYIPNHNYGRFLRQAIESVFRQTLEEFELIIIDDGSTDDSREIIRGYAEHPKVTAIFQRNQGLNVTNNIALRAARGKYIMRLDADDFLDEHALQVMANSLERSPEVGLVFPDFYHVAEDGEVIEIVRRHNFDTVELLDQPAHGACTMIRRQCLLELDGYDESFSCQDGYDLWIRFIQHFEVMNVNLPLFYYRQHGTSLTRNERRLLDTRLQILEKHADARGKHLEGVAVIPVRGASLDPGSIAMRNLAERPLLDWTVEAALRSTRVTRVVVTSPDEEILDHVAEVYGSDVLVVRRDRDLAMPNTAIEDSVFHALEQIASDGHPYDVIAVLYVECPFRTARHIDCAFDVMELFETDSVIGVRPEMDVFYRHDGQGLAPLRSTGALRLEREELFRSTGQMYVVRRTFLEDRRVLVGGTVGHVVLDEQAALYLRSEWDWKVAETAAAIWQEPGEGAPVGKSDGDAGVTRIALSSVSRREAGT